jgi:hypothetical protein|tara:strand:- start:74 stop:712 length:639 start_codon:yes stop_codon:yes gene_type:complete
MNYIQSKVVNWGFKLLTLVVLVGTLFSVANGQVEIQRLKIEREAAREKARQEAKAKNLPVPSIIDVDLIRPTLTVSKFVGTSENIGIKDDRITMGIQQLLQEQFQESDYILTDESDANFTVSAEIVYIGRPNEAFSIVGIFNRRKTKTQVRLNVLLKDNITGKVITSRGMGEIDTKISATGLQIEEDGVPFSNSELGGALRKAIDDATKQLK